MTDYLVQEDGASKFLLEDGSGALLLESSSTGVAPPFISSGTALHAPTVALTNDLSISARGTWSWLCPPGVTEIYVYAYGAGGGGEVQGGNSGGAGGGGGAYAEGSIPVTPGNIYTITAGAGGAAATLHGLDGGSTSVSGDSSSKIEAKGGQGGQGSGVGTGGAGGQASTSTGTVKHSGGAGADGLNSAASPGSGGGASGNQLADGNPGSGASGGAGANGGGSGGNGGAYNTPGTTQAGFSPGGGGGGTGGFATDGGAGADGQIKITVGFVLPFIASNSVVYTPTMPIEAPFIGSTTIVYTPTLPIQVTPPFIGSTTIVYTPELPEAHVPFIASTTHVFGVFSVFNPNWTGVGPGNGGELFPVRLAPNGVTETATLAEALAADDLLVQLAGDGAFPTSDPFVATIDSEIVYLFPRGSGNYSVRGRGMSNTTAAAHLAGATVSWSDSYDQAIRAGSDIAHSFTANIDSSGDYTYYGWLICFDSSQAYLAGARYPMHVSEVLGVFAAGAGASGSNRCDASQPNAVAVPAGISDHCPAALSNPALITSDISIGDVAVVRYTNPEPSALDLGPRSVALQSWFGLKRVDATDGDVTLTDPYGYVVDTIPSGLGPGPFTGSIEEAWPEPLPLATGIAPDASDAAGTPIPTPNPEPWMTVTLPGTDRYFTYGPPHYNEKGWPMCCVAVRQGNRRIPYWQSWDWKNFSYVYTGFGTDDTFAQLLINRNGIVFGSVPTVDLPGPQDIDGPDVVWDDPTYYFAAAWYVVLFGAPYIVFGPGIGGTPTSGDTGGYAPGVTFPSGGGGPVITIPPPQIEGGSGGGITPPPGGVLAWQHSAGPGR